MKYYVLLALFACACLTGTGCRSSQAAAEARSAAEMVLARGGSVVVAGTTVPIKTVANLPQGSIRIQKVDLKGKPVTDADLAKLQSLSGLEILDLDETKITDAGLAHLKGLGRLKELSLYRTPITDKGLEQLRDLNRLNKLELSYTGITDKGADSLAALRNLQTLYLRGTGMTEAGISKLKSSLSRCQIQK